MKNLFTVNVARIVFIYLLSGYLWILFSDQIVHIFYSDPETITTIQIGKGLFYVSVTGVLLYFLINIYRKEIEQKQRESLLHLKKFSSIFESTNAGILTLDSKCLIMDVNPAACELLQLPRHKIIKKPLTEFAYSEKNEEIDLNFLSNIHSYSDIIYLKSADDSLIPIELTLSEFDVEDIETHTALIFHDISERLAIDAKLKDSLREKEIMLAEIHHRVKNNLAIISSLLLLQAEKTDQNQQDIFYTSVQRVKSMALIHEMLYQSENLALLDFGYYIQKLGDSIIKTYFDEEVHIRMEYQLSSAIFLDITRAIPAGLIISELMVNAIKHAFKEKSSGEITISLKRCENNAISVKVSDNGVGMSTGLFESSNGLGFTLVHGLVDQLGGKMNVQSNNGTMFELQIPKPSESKD